MESVTLIITKIINRLITNTRIDIRNDLVVEKIEVFISDLSGDYYEDFGVSNEMFFSRV